METGISVQHGVVLNVGSSAYANGLDIAAHDRIEPDARVIPDFDIPGDYGTMRPNSSFHSVSEFCYRPGVRQDQAFATWRGTSMMMASPWPPPEQMAARPRPPPRRPSS